LRPKPNGSRLPVWIGAGGLAGALLLYFVWQGSGAAKGIPLLRSNHLDLAASREGPGLRVTWNNSSRVFDKASGARLVVKRAGETADQAIELGLDELRLGAVEIENSAPRVDVTLVIEAPGSSPVTQSVNWEGP
jgi:hypothetical protein